MRKTKQVVRLNESQLRQIVKESVKRVLNESRLNEWGWDSDDMQDVTDFYNPRPLKGRTLDDVIEYFSNRGYLFIPDLERRLSDGRLLTPMVHTYDGEIDGKPLEVAYILSAIANTKRSFVVTKVFGEGERTGVRVDPDAVVDQIERGFIE